MANQFSVTPLGGLDVGARLENVMEGARQRKRQMDWQEQAPAVIQSGDPDAIANLMIEYPEMQEKIGAASGYKRKRSIQDMVDTASQILTSEEDPTQLLGQHVQRTQALGEDVSKPMTTLGKTIENPQHSKEWAEKILALYSPKQYQSYKSTIASAEPATTANIKDYTYYRELQKTDPAAAEQFAKQIGIDETTTPKLKPTTAEQNFDRWASMPEGSEKDAFSRIIGVDPKKSPEEERKRLAELDDVAGEVENASDTKSLADQILGNNDYINALVGVRGATPFAVPGGPGKDAEVLFTQLKSSLTLDNLSKMSGVLSDSDIKILQSAGAGIEQGMSRKAFIRRLNTIKNVLERKMTRHRKKLEKAGYYEQPEETLPEGVTEEDIQFTMQKHGISREEVISRLRGQ